VKLIRVVMHCFCDFSADVAEFFDEQNTALCLVIVIVIHTCHIVYQASFSDCLIPPVIGLFRLCIAYVGYHSVGPMCQ